MGTPEEVPLILGNPHFAVQEVPTTVGRGSLAFNALSVLARLTRILPPSQGGG